MPSTRQNTIRLTHKKKHVLDYDSLYIAWGLSNLSLADAKKSIFTHIDNTVPEDLVYPQKLASTLVNLDHLVLASSGKIKIYQGPNNGMLEAMLLRYTKDGALNMGNEHVSFIIDGKNKALLGLVRMLEECDEQHFVMPNEALKTAHHFMRNHAPDLVTITESPDIVIPEGYHQDAGVNIETITDNTSTLGVSLGNVAVIWIDDHAEKLNVGDRVCETHGMKVKMRFKDKSGRYAWIIVDKNGCIQVFERNIFWNFDKYKRETAMWLHDGWLIKHNISLPIYGL